MTFRVLGFPVRIEPSFLLLVIIGFSAGDVTFALWWIAAVFVSTLVHELGHATLLRRYGRNSSITLWGLGGYTKPEGAPLKRPQRIVVSLAGSVTEAVLLGLPSLFLVLQLRDASPDAARPFAILAVFSLVQAGLNLLPILPMDGGRIMENLLQAWKGENPEEGVPGESGARAARWVSIVVAAIGGVILYINDLRTEGLLFPAFLIALNVRDLSTLRDASAWRLVIEGQSALEGGDAPLAARKAERVLAGTKSLRVRGGAIELLAWTHLAAGNRTEAGRVLGTLPEGLEPTPFTTAFVMLLDGLHDAALETATNGLMHPEIYGAPNRLLVLQFEREGLLDRLIERLLADTSEVGPRVAWVLSSQLHFAGSYEASVRVSRAVFDDGRIEVEMSAYNIACSLARLGRIDEAGDWLATAIEKGFRDRAMLEGDEDLAALRSHPAFRRASALLGLGSPASGAWSEPVVDTALAPPRHHGPVDRMSRHIRSWIRASGSLPGGRVVEDGDATWVTTGIAWPMFNGGTGGDPATVRRAIRELREVGVPFFWWVPEGTPDEVVAVLAEEGLTRFEDDAPWEEAPLASLPDAQMPPGITMKEVLDEEGHRIWAATLRAAYEAPPAAEQGWIEPARRSGYQGLPWRQWVAYIDGEPAGVTLQFSGGGVASLYAVGVLPSARRRGVGRVLTLLPLKEATEEIAGFFSSDVGSKLYRTLGFKSMTTLTRWVWMPGSELLGKDAARGERQRRDRAGSRRARA